MKCWGKRLRLSAEIAQNAGQNAEQAAHADLQRRVADQLLELFLIGQRLLQLGKQVDELVQELCLLAVSSRTPIASCMTMIATITLMANGNESSP